MSKREWTIEQAAAIADRGGTLLIGAGAGSGKTAVLTQRVMGLIADKENPIDADRILVVTFTNAATGEMRQRISANLADLIAENHNDKQLKRQQLLFEKAHISTVHAFYLDLVREYAHLLELPPDFSVADNAHCDILKAQAIQDVFTKYYDEESLTFFELIDLMGGRQNDLPLQRAVLKLYEFVRAHPFFDAWLDEKLAMYRPRRGIENTPWAECIFAYAKGACGQIVALLESAIAVIRDDEVMSAAYLEAFAFDLINAERLGILIARKDWDGTVDFLAGQSHQSLGQLRKYGDDARKKAVRDMREEVKKIFSRLADKLFCATARQFGDDVSDLYTKVELLFTLVKEFDTRFGELKRARRLVDFSDMEQFAVRLLCDRVNGAVVPSRIAREVSRRFDEIMIDEYQDTNEAQDTVFRMISRDGANLFMVGDVKQSIYRFRQAMPEIFLAKQNSFADYASGLHPAKIPLVQNFRSRKEVIDSVNRVFELIFSDELGDVKYDDGQKLIPALPYPAGEGYTTEIDLVECAGLTEEESKTEAEAAHVAAKIKAMLEDGFRVMEDGEMRPVKPGDIAVLLRSTGASSGGEKGKIYIKALEDAGIPASSGDGEQFLGNKFVSYAVSALKAVCNPLLDIPLVAAMMSPIFCFSPDELAGIRLFDRQAPIYACVNQAAGAGDEKCRNLLDTLNELTAASTYMTSDAVIRRLFKLTGYVETVNAIDSTKTAESYLNALVGYAAGYEKLGYKGLPAFISLIGRIIETGSDIPGFTGTAGAGSAVSVMSIHRSKGLEFPVVFLADAAKQFNREDIRDRVLVHPRLGFACKRKDAKLGCRFPTVPMAALQVQIDRDNLSEEMRVLYVAMTRAREKLIVTGAMDNVEARMQKLSARVHGEEAIPPYSLLDCQSFADWLMLCDIQSKHQKPVWALSVVYPELTVGANIVRPRPEESSVPEADPALVAEIERCAGRVYPFEAAVGIPAKLSVSEITKSDSHALNLNRYPKFMYGELNSGAARGTVVHKFMQFADYNLARQSCRRELERLVERRYLTPDQAKLVDIRKLEAFFGGELLARMLSADKLYRELNFLDDVDAAKLGYAAMGESVTVQGIADCVFEEDGHLVIVDYKTDYVQTEDELKERYAGQVFLYRDILEKRLGKPVKECVLYSFHFGREIIL